jgi:hypothetical protein
MGITLQERHSRWHRDANFIIDMRRAVLVGLIACTRAQPTPSATGNSDSAIGSAATPAAPVASAPPSSSAAPTEKLDALTALENAKTLGMKETTIVPHPVRCPGIAPPSHDTSRMTAPDLLVAIDAFLSEDMDVPEAAAILGAPALCNQSELSEYSEYHLAPKPPNLHAAALETKSGALIGIQIELEKPIVIDMTALQKRYGRPTRGPAHSFEAGSDNFSVTNAAFSAQLMFSHEKHTDPLTARKVHRAIFRRTPMLEILPDDFKTESDVVRLVALALAPSARDAVSFAGSLGVYAEPVDGKITFQQARTDRNVAKAIATVRSAGMTNYTRALDVTFITPIPVDPTRFAKAIAPHKAHGTVTTDLAGGALKHLVIERTE